MSSLPKIAGMLDQSQGVHLQSLALPTAVLRNYCMTTGEPRAAVGFTSQFSRFPWWFLPHCSGELVERVSLASPGFSK